MRISCFGSLLAVSKNRMRLVWLFKRSDFFIRQSNRKRINSILEMIYLPAADNWRCNAGLLQQPCQCHLCRLHSFLTGNFSNAIDDGEILVGIIQLVSVFVGFRPDSFSAPATLASASEESSGKRTPGYYTNPFFTTQRQHLSLFFTIDQIIVILHADETCPAVEV